MSEAVCAESLHQVVGTRQTGRQQGWYQGNLLRRTGHWHLLPDERRGEEGKGDKGKWGKEDRGGEVDDITSVRSGGEEKR